MTERILGPTGPKRRARLRLLFPLIGLCLLVVAIGASSAGALTTASPPSFTWVNDESGADDQPGQKDLSAHAAASPTPGDLWVAWKWDDVSLSGGNTGDACALFDSGAPRVGAINFAVCVTIAGNPAAQVAGTSPRIYTCGDSKVDRCTSTYALVAQPPQYGTACSVNQAGVDRTDPWHPGKLDTTALCHIDLNDVGGGTAKLVNTCSYPSQQPTSAPSDCVLIPRDAFLTIAKDAGGNTSNFNFTVSGGATATPTVAGGSSTTIPIKSATATSVIETLPSSDWTFVSATCAGGTNQGTATTNGRTGITAASDTTVTCTFVNQLRPAPLVTINKSCPDGVHATTDRFQPKNGSADAGNAIACGGSTSFTATPDVAYNITEAAAGDPAANLANYTTTYSADCNKTLARGGTATCTITNALKAAPLVTINKSCPNGVFASGDRFQPKDGLTDAGDAIACGESTSYTATPDTAYDITEDGTGTPAADLANYTTTYSPDCTKTLARGETATCTITNTLRTFTVVTYVCEGDELYASSVTFGSDTKTSLAHNVVLPVGVSETTLCSDITGGARFTGTKSGTKSGSVTIPTTP
jgi:hypothetical protein